jgi:chromosome segregation ATPase
MKDYMVHYRVMLFLGAAFMIYAYASQALAAQNKNMVKNTINIKVADAYTIWKQINKIENAWYLLSGEVAPFDSRQNIFARDLGLFKSIYSELKDPITALLQARKDNDIIAFTQQKEAIAVILRDVWTAAIKKEREEREKMSYFEWIKEKFAMLVNNLSSYFTVKKEAPKKMFGTIDPETGAIDW